MEGLPQAAVPEWQVQHAPRAAVARAAAKLDTCAARQARDALLDVRRPASSPETAQEIESLAAVPATQQEQDRIAAACAAAAMAARRTPPPAATSIRRA
eukprot:1744753-Lingulodinium_polyedra.AAC.1